MDSVRRQRAQKLFADYDANHRTAGNRATHFVGIPFIVFSALGLAARLHLIHLPFFNDGGADVDLGQLLWLFAAVFYLYLVPGIGVLFSLLLLAAYFVARLVPITPLWILFAAGWILQFIGHSRFEKKQPSFFNNVQHLMVGPIWIFAKTIGVKLTKDSTLT